jgi:PAT family beta-lactamase induction signal transducer AmpG
MSDSDIPQARAWAVYLRPRMLSMLALGFSSGLPFMLVFSTLSAWLRQAGIQRSTIGMLAWVSLVYTLKFLWSPILDRWKLPLLHGWLGRRRSWILLTQLGVAAGLALLALGDPLQSVIHMALMALLVAISAATQDMAIDAWRIESAPLEEQGAMAAAYQLGFRVAVVVGSAGALWLAADYGWHASYTAMAACMSLGVLTTLLVAEPVASADSVAASAVSAASPVLRAVIEPLMDFMRRYGWQLGLLLLAFISSYRVTDYAMGVMANPFYLDTGFTLKQVAAIVKIYGTVMTVVGILAGGFAVAKLGRVGALVLGSVLVMSSNLAYSVFAGQHVASELGLAGIISLDNFAQGVHGTALIAFLSSLTNRTHTATQYALLSSVYALFGKLLMGASGFIVDAIGYPSFYLYTASLSIPPLLLLWWLKQRTQVFNTVSGEAQ